jgi:hypothetical protein
VASRPLPVLRRGPPETAAAKLAAGLDRFVPDPAEHSSTGLRLSRLLGVPFPGDSGAADRDETLSREELFADWRLFFERLAAEGRGRAPARGVPRRWRRGRRGHCPHYLDALHAIPDDPDATEIRGQAITALTRAAERAERTGAPAQAAASYAAVAELSPPGAPGEAAGWWERAAQAALADAPSRSPWARRSASARASSPSCWSPAGFTISWTSGDRRRSPTSARARGSPPARTAAGHLRRTGHRRMLGAAIMNAVEALIQIGDWPTAEAELTQAVDSDALADMEDVICDRGWLAVLRGDAGTAEAMRAALRSYRSSEDPQDQGWPASWTGSVPWLRAGSGRWPRAARPNWATPRPSANCSTCSTPISPVTSPSCCEPNATWSAPGSGLRTHRATPQPRSPPRSRTCASRALPITSLTACSTTPSTCNPRAMPRTLTEPPPRPSRRPAASLDTCAARRCWTGRPP